MQNCIILSYLLPDLVESLYGCYLHEHEHAQNALHDLSTYLRKITDVFLNIAQT